MYSHSLALCSFWNWDLSPFHQGFLCTLSCDGRTTTSVFSGLVQIYCSIPSRPNMSPSFTFYSLLSLLTTVALSKWKMKKPSCFKWSAPRSAPQMNPAKVNLHDCFKCSCCHRSLERPASWPILNTQSLIHGRNLIMDIHFFLRTAE